MPSALPDGDPAPADGVLPAQALDGLTAALSGGQVQAAADGAQQAATTAQGPSVGQQAFDLVHQVGTSSVVDALNRRPEMRSIEIEK